MFNFLRNKFRSKMNKYSKVNLNYRELSYDEYKERLVKEEGNRYQKQLNNVWKLDTKGNNAQQAVILCAGDLMCEPVMSENAYFEDTGEYFFKPCFKYIRKVIKSGDFALANLETMVTEKAPYTRESHRMNHHTGVRYHCNAPVSYLEACKYCGFDGFVLANNHNADCGYEGLVDTLHNIDLNGFMRTGLFCDENDSRTLIVDINGIKVGVLSYTEHINRGLDKELFTEKGRKVCFNRYSKSVVKNDINELKKRNVDFTIVYIHFLGKDYSHTVVERQVITAQEIADVGADCIMGSHMHAVQKCDIITAKDGRKVPVAYSLGNFITSDNTSDVTKKGIIFKLILKKENNLTGIAKISYIPYVVVENIQRSGGTVLPTQIRWRRYKNSEWLDKVQQQIVSVVGDVIDLDEDDVDIVDKQIPKEKIDLSADKFKSIIKARLSYNDSGKDYVCKELIERASLGTDFDFRKVNFDDEKYTCLRFASDTEPGCAAFVTPITSNPAYRITDADREKYSEIAIRKGAKVLVSDKYIKDFPCIVVNSVFKTWCNVHKVLRKNFSPKVIGITGSIGKTTTTQMIYHVVSQKFNTHRNTGSANNVRYVGNVLQNLKRQNEVYVQEIMEGPPYGGASTISDFVNPDIAVITRIGTSHIEVFGNQQRITETCYGIEDGMPSDGILVLNADDEYQIGYTNKKHRFITYGIDNVNADCRATDIKCTSTGIVFNLHYENITREIKLNCLGNHNVYNALAAFVVARKLDISADDIVIALSKFETSGIRQNLIHIGSQRIFLDCYNASIETIAGALASMELIKQSEKQLKIIAVIADVLELGEKTESDHRAIGELVLTAKVDGVILYGNNMRFAKQHIDESDKTDKQVWWTDNFDELVELVKKNSGDDVLLMFKGSHGMALEQVVDTVFGTYYHEQFEKNDHIAKDGVCDGLKYMEYSDHITICGSIVGKSKLVIPEKILGKPVTGIEKSAFTVNQDIVEIVLPNTISNIRYCSFYKNSKLDFVRIPSNIKIIEASAFSTCDNLRKVIIEEGCQQLGYRAFGNCRNLESICIPPTVTSIGNEAFINCKKMTIYGKLGSFAEKYAKNRKINFKEIKN